MIFSLISVSLQHSVAICNLQHTTYCMATVLDSNRTVAPRAPLIRRPNMMVSSVSSSSWWFNLGVVGVLVWFGGRQSVHALSSSSSSVSSSQQPLPRCVVVGGGPVGLATALTLSNPPHHYNVTVLEQSSTVQRYDPTRAYLYNVNPRGLEWLEEFPAAARRLIRDGVDISQYGPMGACTVPANPQEPIVGMQTMGGVFNTSRTLEDAAPLNNKDENDSSPPFFNRSSSIWVQRHQMVQLLLETCHEQAQSSTSLRRDASSSPMMQQGSIQVLHGKQVTNLAEENDNGLLQVHCADGTEYAAHLVVAADGIDSQVRTTLAAESSTLSSWLQSRSQDFRVRQFVSPSAGVKLKCLQFPPGFPLTNTSLEEDVIPTTSTTTYVIRSVNTGDQGLSLGLLPVKDPTLIRPANIITRPNHKIWSLTTGPAIKEYMTKSFPRLQWDAIVQDEAEWDRFAKATGTTYPKPQYSPGSAVASPHHPDTVGIALVGDACHAFPPDIGQGINSGLNDVLALDRCLQGKDVVTNQPLTTTTTTNRRPTLSEALERYQANRGPEHAALIRLARFGAPYQYRQSWLRDRIGAKLWLANVILRQVLTKVTKGWITPAAMIQTYQIETERPYTYRQVMQQADSTTRKLQVLAAACLTVVCWAIKRVLLGGR